MTFNLDDLSVIYPDQLWLELSATEQENAWQQTSNEPYSHSAARCNAYLNCLCLNAFLAWLKEDPDLQQTSVSCPECADLNSYWEFVNGTLVTVGETRIVLICSDKSNLTEFEIPREWMDIPDWAANYYLAVQLNLESGWVRVWGYATYQQIRSQAEYNLIERTYSLNAEDLIEDLNIMWVARELCPQKKLEVAPLLTLSPIQAENLLQQLSKQTDDFATDISFPQWAALLVSDNWRQRLYELRTKNLKNTPPKNNLSQWFENIFTSGWQHFDEFLTPQQKTLVLQLRSEPGLNEVRIKGAKVIDLGMQLGGIAVVLLVGLTLEIDDKVSMRVQLHPDSGETYLPGNLRLLLLSESGKILQEVQSRSHDHYIQLKRFKSPLGNSFSIQMILGDVSIKEDFMLEPPVN